MNIILFGAPGAGKGTQSELLVKQLGMVQISTGDLFRAAIKNKTALGEEAQKYMNKGELVPDSVTIGMVGEALQKLAGKSFILDGFPRNVAQADALDALLKKNAITLGKAIFIEVPMKLLQDRLTGRRVCKSCASVYHIHTKPTLQPGVCDKCGGEVVQRPDDKEEVIGTRLKAYEDNTLPLKAYYKGKGQFFEVNGNQEVGPVFAAIKKEIL